MSCLVGCIVGLPSRAGGPDSKSSFCFPADRTWEDLMHFCNSKMADGWRRLTRTNLSNQQNHMRH